MAAGDPPPREVEEDDEEDVLEEGEAGAQAEKKKKKRNKKKKKAEGEDAAAVDEEPVEAPAAPAVPAAPAPAVDGDEDEADEEDGEDGAAEDGAKKKKKKKKKKKTGEEGMAAASGSGPKVRIATGGTDEEFAKWCEAALAATRNESENMSPEDRLKPPKAFWGHKYTGDLRPSFVTPQMKMPADIAAPDYANDPDGVAHSERQGPKEVPILEGEELKTMREACRLGREILDIAARFMREGVTGDEIDRIVYQACVDRKIYPSPLNYYRFPKSVCVSANEVICHGIPDCRPIREGDIVNLDVSICYKEYHSDLNETFLIGQVDEDGHRLVRTAYQALQAASKLIRPGTFYRDLGNVIHTEAAKNNCSVVTTYCGHGVGKLFHGPPKVPHYRKNKAVGIMKPGHVFTVEPMLNLGGNGGDKTWPDNWTAVTKDGNRSAQFEHTFLVTETGCEVLTMRPGTNITEMPEYTPEMLQR